MGQYSCYITVYYVVLYYEVQQKITTGDVLNTLIHYLFNFYRKVKGNILTVTQIVLFDYLMLSHSLFETNSLRTLRKVEGVTWKPLGPLAWAFITFKEQFCFLKLKLQYQLSSPDCWKLLIRFCPQEHWIWIDRKYKYKHCSTRMNCKFVFLIYPVALWNINV